MQHRKLSIALAGIMLAATSFAASADILFTNLGNVAPPASIGGHTLTPFDTAPQHAIPEFSAVSSIPGGPGGTAVGISPAAYKVTDGVSWNASTTWPGGYNGPMYFSNSGTTETLTLPANTKAFYFYVESNYHSSSFYYTATTNSGATSAPVLVAGGSGGNGFAFYSTAGENITSITISGEGLNGGGFIVGQLGINSGPTTTCASEGYTYTKLEWCKNICERG
ncbi:hypothetical protein [Thermomonas sp.]|uniref:hypothetical protein n=1 Tax=Thermomonas sp. TaxID=1971895 RepID=UPI00260611E6|nr:hypothetical protein [Thermomonas sp.]MBL0228111.1 hypothetical protein [Thermomonas sp.]